MPASTVPVSPCRGYRFPPEIITHAVWLDHRFSLSHREVEELLAERGIRVSYEAIRLWCRRFGPLLASELRRRRPRRGDKCGSADRDHWPAHRRPGPLPR